MRRQSALAQLRTRALLTYGAARRYSVTAEDDGTNIVHPNNIGNRRIGRLAWRPSEIWLSTVEGESVKTPDQNNSGSATPLASGTTVSIGGLVRSEPS